MQYDVHKAASIQVILLHLSAFFWMLHFFEEPAGTVCHSFKVFRRGYILLELEMISFILVVFILSSE